MATSQSTMDYLIDQLARLGSRIRARKMFGEYALYCDDKVVALVCDNQLFLKPTAVGKKLLGTITEAPPYPGASMYYLLSDETVEDRELLVQLLSETADVLPLPKPKKITAKKS